MNQPNDRPLLADLRDELRGLGAELRDMLAARWELARLEMAADGRALRVLVLVWLAALVMILTAVPLLAVYFAELLDGCCGVPRSAWLLRFALALMGFALAGGYLAYRRFRRKVTGLQETLEEIREDLVWLKEKAGGKKFEG